MPVGAQTLYGISQISPVATVVESPASRIYSAIGVGADGATTYVEEDIESFIAFIFPSTTEIVLSEPTTLTGTFVQDASGERASTSSGLVYQAETCGFGADGHGTCVDEFGRGSLTVTQTFSGVVEPFYTFPSAATLSAPFIPPSRAIFCALAVATLVVS
ncbi:hypothetical protein FB451DRAFT_1393038 [Mycena latifolia]|nr:hypothetical protein FB451DRAFT_1393038 [Mycena latifolia]